MPAITDFGASLPLVTAALLEFRGGDGAVLELLAPTLFFGRPAATAAPPRAMNSAIEAITFA